MNKTLRQFLKELFSAFEEHSATGGVDTTEFTLMDNLMEDGEFILSSSACPFTLRTVPPLDGNPCRLDVMVNIDYDLDTDYLIEVTPQLTLGFSRVDLSNPTTWLDLYVFFTSSHPYIASSALDAFVQQCGEVSYG